jgi:hypothetical protein
MEDIREGYEAYIGVGGGGRCWGNLMDADHLEDLGINRRVRKIYSERTEWSVETEFVALNIGTGVGMLQTQ